MYTVYVAAREEMRVPLVQAIKGYPGAILNGSSVNLRQALGECAGEHPGVFLIDDALLAENVGLLDQLSQLPYPTLVVGSEGAAARRALVMRARDLVPLERWTQELQPALERVATPIEGGEVPAGKVIVVFSSKGGVGKSTVSLNLAVALAKVSKRPTALVDLDVQFGDLAAMLGEMPKATIHDLVLEETIDWGKVERVLATIPDSHAKFLAAPAAPQEAEDIGAEHVVRILQLLKEHFAYVVIDTAPGYSEINVGALDFCDLVFTVCTPDVVTIRTVSQALRLFYEGFRYPPQKVRLVMNRAGSRTGVESQDIVKTLNNPINHQLPSDGLWPVKAANSGRPLVLLNADSAVSKGVTDIARQIVDQYEGPSRKAAGRAASRGSFWDRLGFKRRGNERRQA
ncbi:MAG: AAA family ATPase [Thermaerobacter sp.]|nr:AAA family ATPase [Thermaerobacter sp.]